MPKSSSSNPPAKVNWWRAVCRPATTTKLTNILGYGDSRGLSKESPIDQYFARSEALIVFGNQALLDSNAEIANLLFIGVISHTENYFRELFSKLLQICPTSQIKASSRDIKLGSVIWFRTGKIERGAFEGFSFASSDNLTDTVRKYFDLTLDPKSDCHALLEEFDRLCELRHAIVHSGGVMSGKNALKLQFPRTDKDVHVKMTFARFQEASSICSALVCSFNSDLFKYFCMRWKDDWPKKLPNWTPRSSNKAFAELWDAFHSNVDASRGAIAVPLTRMKCKTEILRP